MKKQNLYKELVITRIEKATKDVKFFYLQSMTDPIIYKAGQYLTFVLKEEESDIRRSYSLSSSPELNEPMVIGVKRIANGIFSRKLFDQSNVGDKLYTQGAAGFFTLPPDLNNYTKLIFFAAGSGIVPVFSLIKTALHTSNIQVVLIYSNHNKETTVFYKELQHLQYQFKEQLQIKFLFSNNKNLAEAHLHASLIEDYLMQFNANAATLFYLCGPESYMRLCTYTLQRNGINASQIKKEIFNTSVKIYKPEPPDKAPHTIQLEYKNSIYKLDVQYPKTILRAAFTHNINLPYSCETGRCGNCAAFCKTGKVWMYHNEVLTEKELKDGMILTCTSYPISDDVSILIE